MGALALGLIAACDVDGLRDDVAESFERPEVTERFVEEDEPADELVGTAIDGAVGDRDDDGESGTGVEFVEPLDPLAGFRPNAFADDSLGATRTSDIIGSAAWTTVAEVPGAEVDLSANLDLDLYELEDAQLVGLELIDEADVDVSRSTKWFRVEGVLAWDLQATRCRPSPDVDGCELASATDGSIVGLAELNGNALTVSLSWRILGRSAEAGVPMLDVVVIDASARQIEHEVDELRESVEAAFVDWEFRIELDGGPRPFTSIGADGHGTLRFDRV